MARFWFVWDEKGGGEGRGSCSFSPSGAYRGGQSVRGEGRGVGARVLGNGVRPSDNM